MVKSYDELQGGRSGRYSPERRRVTSLLSAEASPKLRVGNMEYPLFDLSVDGLSVAMKPKLSNWVQGTELECEVVVHNRSIFQGSAQIAEIEQRGNRAHVDLNVTRGFLDVEEAQRIDAELKLDRALTQYPSQSIEKLPASFREAVANTAIFISYYRKVLDQYEQDIDNTRDDFLIQQRELVERSLNQLRRPWRNLCEAASKAALPFIQDPGSLFAGKMLTESLVTPLLLNSPMIERAYQKPLGYPGDYQVMLYYYENLPRGKTTHAQVFHKLFVEHPLSNGVRTRNDFVVDHLLRDHQQVCSQSKNPIHYRAMSLGCGPAREARDFISRTPNQKGKITWLLVDQERAALDIAHSDCRKAIAKVKGNGEIIAAHLGFARLLRDPQLLGDTPPQDFICSTGLFDYLRPERAQAVIRWLYDLLKPGGTLMIGNAKGPNCYFWSAEFVLDWPLIYRTKQEMFNLTSDLPEHASREVELEPGGAYYYLVVRKNGPSSSIVN